MVASFHTWKYGMPCKLCIIQLCTWVHLSSARFEYKGIHRPLSTGQVMITALFNLQNIFSKCHTLIVLVLLLYNTNIAEIWLQHLAIVSGLNHFFLYELNNHNFLANLHVWDLGSVPKEWILYMYKSNKYTNNYNLCSKLYYYFCGQSYFLQALCFLYHNRADMSIFLWHVYWSVSILLAISINSYLGTVLVWQKNT